MTAQAARAKPAPARFRTKRSSLMISCAAAALVALAGAAGRADAQAFQGTPTIAGPNIATQGTATRTITSQTSETITVQSSTATINWSPSDTQGTGTIDFLPSGHTATFTNDPQSTANFTVLNRILPRDTSRPIALNGNVVSQLQDLSGNVSTGGRVWFYSPGGIVVGSTAVFDVGSLLLTANDPVSFGLTTGGVTGQFVADPGSNAAVTIHPGAQINATAENSYVALIAPVVDQGGSVRVNGSAAYIGGEDVSMTINQGLFDITVNVGTTDANGVRHTGSTGGPASTGAGDDHRIYMVAVPKNQAMSMFLGGSVGFDTATSASVDNGQIILSAGHNVAGDTVSGPPVGTGSANIHIDAGTYTSDVYARATDDAFVASQVGDTTFRGDLTLVGGDRAHVGARNGHIVTILGNAIVSNGRSGLAGPSDGIATGGGAMIYAEAASKVDIRGNADVDAAAAGGAGQSATGGVARFDANGGAISVGGNVLLNASAVGGAGAQSGAATNASAGEAAMSASAGGTIAVGGNIEVRANAVSGPNGGAATGGTRQGGDASIIADGGSIEIDGSASLFASAFQSAGAPATGGTFSAGDAQVIADNAGEIEVGGELNVNANASAEGGSSQAQSGGNAVGGGARVVAARGGSITGQGAASLYAFGVGGAGASGGNGTGGSVMVGAHEGGTVTLASGQVHADGTGGASSAGNAGTGSGGNVDIRSSGTGSKVSISADPRRISGSSGFISAVGTGGRNGGGGTLAGGTGTGGDVRILADSGGSTGLTTVGGVIGSNRILAGGTGGAAAAEGGKGGEGRGGTIEIGADAASFAGNALQLDVVGRGGSSASAGLNITGGDGVGGELIIFSTNGGVTLFTGTGAGGGSVLYRVDDALGTDYFAQALAASGYDVTTVSGSLSGIDLSDYGLVVYANQNSSTPSGDISILDSYIGGGGRVVFANWLDEQPGLDATHSGTNNLTQLTLTQFTEGVGTNLTAVNPGWGTFSYGLTTSGGAVAGTWENGQAAIVIGNEGRTIYNGFLTDTVASTQLYNNEVSLLLAGAPSGGSAGGVGGNGSGMGPGGAGIGGSVDIDVANGQLQVSGSLEFNVQSAGGTGRIGGNATAGIIAVNVSDGGKIVGGGGSELTLAVGAAGGDGVAGAGSAAGGAAVVDIDETGSIELAELSVTSSNRGGAAEQAQGGEATGGAAAILSSGNMAIAGQALVSAGATGGAGTSGGDGTGGTASLLITGTSEFAGSLTVRADAAGGAGTSGAGGRGTGGSSQLWIFEGEFAAGSVNASAIGTGGSGGNAASGAGGAGGEGQGGSATVLALSAAQVDFGDVTANAAGTGGAGGTGTTVGGTGGRGTGGSVLLHLLQFQTGQTDASAAAAAVGSGTAGAVSMSASGTGGAGGSGGTGGTAGAAGHGGGGSAGVEISGAELTAESIALTANGSTAGGTSSLGVRSGIDGTGAGKLQTAALTATANGGNQAGHVLVQVSAGSSAALGTTALRALGAAGDAEAGGGGIVIDLGTPAFLPPEGVSALAAGTTVTAASMTLETGGNIEIWSQGGTDLAVAGALQANAAGSIMTGAGGDGATGGTIRAADVDFTAGDVSSGLAIEAVHSIEIAAAGDFEVGALRAGDSIDLSAGGTANFLGLVSAPEISVASADIDVEENGQLGEAGVTQTLALTARSSGEPVVVGGEDSDEESDGGYELSGAEAERIEAAAITFTATASGEGPAPNILLRDLTIGGSGTEGGGVGKLEVSTGGSVVVEGRVLYADAGAEDSLSITAGDRIEVVTPTGGIAMVGDGNAPAGALTLTAANIWAGDEALLAKLAADPNFAGRDQALATSNGSANPGGVIAAGAVTLAPGETLFVQNTGTANDLGGITVGDGGLSIRPSGEAPATVVAYGRRVSSGGTSTGRDFFEEVDFGTAEGAVYAAGSTFNGCEIGGQCFVPPPPAVSGPEQVLGPVEVIDGDDDPEGGSGGVGVSMSNGLIDTGDVTIEPLIEEPVTSGGDSSLWVDDDDDDDDDDGEN